MKANDFAVRAEEFSNALTCYLKGFWGQRLSRAEFDRIARMYPENLTYGNEKYIGTDVFPFDCICFVKALLGNASTVNRVPYDAIKNCSIGDIDNPTFLNILKANHPCNPKDAKRGMGLATNKHAGIALGGGKWVDANLTNGQNGVKVHTSGIEQFTVAGEIPGLEYDGVNVGDVIPMTVTRIEGDKAYGFAVIGDVPQVITVGSKVTINPGAKAGGMNKNYRGLYIDEKYANGKYVDEVVKIETHYGVEEALLKGINTWVAVSSLKLA